MCPALPYRVSEQTLPIATREITRGMWHASSQPALQHKFHAFLVASVPRTLLHCGADKLADQRQELLRVPGMKLLQQGEQSQDKRWPIHRVGRFPADHSCKDDRLR